MSMNLYFQTTLHRVHHFYVAVGPIRSLQQYSFLLLGIFFNLSQRRAAVFCTVEAIHGIPEDV